METFDAELARWLADAARSLEATHGNQGTLDEICKLAVGVVAGCRWAGVNEDHDDHGETLAATDDTALALHDLQHEIGEGPCLGAVQRQRVVWSDDLAADDRWPRFSAKATAYGVRSVLSIQLYTRGDIYGALNLFSDQPGAFDEVTRDVARSFAAHAAVAIAAARNDAQLHRALTTRQRIGQATGILAERHNITTDQAFAMLVHSSSTNNIKLRDIADRLVTSEDAARSDRRS